MSAPDNATLRAWIAAARPSVQWGDPQADALYCAAPALAEEVLALRSERDDLYAAARVRVHVTDDVARVAEWAAADLLALRAAAREWARHVGDATLQGATPAYLDAAARLRALATGAAYETARDIVMPRAAIVNAVLAERARQDARWGEQNHPDVDRELTDRDGGCTPARMAMEHLVVRASVARLACERAAARGQCTWAHILVEEVAELVEAATLAQQGQGPEEDVGRELVQVAAVCVSWLEARARRARKG